MPPLDKISCEAELCNELRNYSPANEIRAIIAVSAPLEFYNTKHHSMIYTVSQKMGHAYYTS